MSTWPTIPPPPPAAKRTKGFWTKAIIVIALAGLIGGALVWKLGRNTYHDYQISSDAVDRFHQELNAGDYAQIYEDATDEFRRAGSREDLNKFFDNIRQKMGTAGKRNPAGFHVNWQNGRLWVDQVFNTQFEKGQGQEYFLWEIRQGQPHLYHYRVDSPNLR